MGSIDTYSYESKARQGSRNVFELLGIVQRLAVIAENQLDGEHDTNRVHEQEIEKLNTRLRQDGIGIKYLRKENRTLREEKERLEKKISSIMLSLEDAYSLKKDDPELLPRVVDKSIDELKTLTNSPEAPF